jgi:hypothetical protein
VIDWVLPKDLKVTLGLVKALQTEKAAVGDMVEFAVTRNAALRKQVWLERGARVVMRVGFLRCVEAPVTGCAIGLIPQSFTAGNKSGRFAAEREEPSLGAMLSHMGPATRSMAVSLRLADADLPAGASLLIFRGRQLNTNFQTVWRTLESSGDQAP